jgi:hypothetical protein
MNETRYYRNCDEISVYNFYKVLETNNYAYLIVDYDDYQEVDFNEKEANELWISIYEEYCKLTEDNKSLLYFAVFQELLYLRTRFEVATILLRELSNGIKDDSARLNYIDSLRTWKYKINVDKPLEDELDRMVAQLKVSANKINIKQAELDELKVDDSEKLSLIEQTVKLEQALGRNEIDLKRTVVSKYIALFKEVKLLNEARKKQNNNK